MYMSNFAGGGVGGGAGSASSSTASGSGSSGAAAAAAAAPDGTSALVDKQRLEELVSEVDGSTQLDDDVEDFLLQMTDDFVDNLVMQSCALARHRGAPALEVNDVQLILEKNLNMYIPGFGQRATKKIHHQTHHQTEAHKQRMSLIRKSMKKF